MKTSDENSQLLIEKKITDLISKLTLEEKIGQLMQIDKRPDYEDWILERNIGSFLNVISADTELLAQINRKTRMNIPIIQAIDAVHGHCFHDGAVVFPTPLAMSCSWNPKLIEKVGKITAKEMRITGFHWTFAPNLDLARDPRWGRVNETFGEDPFLVAEMGQAMIEGLQNNGEYSVAACPKHFAAYGESIGGRDSVESEVSERKLRSLFLPPFQKAINTGAMTIMTAYQAIDGTPCTINYLLLDQILFGEWGFEGVVITDYDNITRLHTEQYVMENPYDASIATLKSGNHVMMGTPHFYEDILKAIRMGQVSEEHIDRHVRRVLRLKFKLGLFDNTDNLMKSEMKNIVGCSEHRNFAKKVCEESIVLLKNNGILPIQNTSKKIAVIGPNAINRISQLGDWGIRSNFGKQDHEMGNDHMDTYVSVFAGIKSVFINTRYHYGCTINTDEEDIESAVQIASESDYIIAVVGDNLGLNGEIKDRATLELTGRQMDLLKSLKGVGIPLIVVLINGKPLILNWVDEYADAILETFNPGLEGGNAISNIISGKVNPSGKLTTSFPRHVGQLPVYYNQIPGWHGNSNGTGDYIDMTAETLYPFGFGLSYSTFEYTDLKVLTADPRINKPVEISFRVRNTGEYDGYETTQVYFNDLYSSTTTPKKVLIGFRKVYLKVSEEIDIRFTFESASFSFIDRSLNRVVEPGEFEIMVGKSSLDADLIRTKFKMKR